MAHRWAAVWACPWRFQFSDAVQDLPDDLGGRECLLIMMEPRHALIASWRGPCSRNVAVADTASSAESIRGASWGGRVGTSTAPLGQQGGARFAASGLS
jgi:hypothetical protein